MGMKISKDMNNEEGKTAYQRSFAWKGENNEIKKMQSRLRAIASGRRMIMKTARRTRTRSNRNNGESVMAHAAHIELPLASIGKIARQNGAKIMK